MKQKKTCGKNQHVRIDNIYRKANLICCRTDDAVEINLRYYTVQLANAQGLENVCGIAADSSKLYLPNNVLRECCGILKDWVLNNI